jgi:hypothetical protein
MQQNQVTNSEQIEKVRQQIMRFHELLHVMREKLESGERAYAALFSGFSPEDVAGTKEKDLQWKAAETLMADVSPLSRAVMQMRFEARNLERDFEELYNIIVSVQDTE